MSESSQNWSEPTYSGVPRVEPETTQAQYDQLVMKWQEAREVAGEENETTEFYSKELTKLLEQHPELYPEDIV